QHRLLLLRCHHYFFVYCYVDHRVLHSFPTRRSSDLDAYTNDEVLSIIRNNVDCEVKPRSTRLKPSSIAFTHPFVQAGIALGRTTDRKSTRLNSSHVKISYAVFCLKKKKIKKIQNTNE